MENTLHNRHDTQLYSPSTFVVWKPITSTTLFQAYSQWEKPLFTRSAALKVDKLRKRVMSMDPSNNNPNQQPENLHGEQRTFCSCLYTWFAVLTLWLFDLHRFFTRWSIFAGNAAQRVRARCVTAHCGHTVTGCLVVYHFSNCCLLRIALLLLFFKSTSIQVCFAGEANLFNQRTALYQLIKEQGKTKNPWATA